MKKKINCLLMSLSLALGGIALSSCSLFGDQPYSIDEITYTYDDEGNTFATIHYTEEAGIPDVTFKINRGIGIKDIKTVHDVEHEKVIITISFTDSKIPDTVVSIPVMNGVDGKDGAGIKEILVDEDKETGDTHLTISYTDDRQPTKITIPKGVKGDKGEKGDGILSIEPSFDPVTYETIITITLTNGSDPIEFRIPAGLNGVGILEVNVKEDTESYVTFEIVFDNLQAQEITVNKSRATKWYSGNLAPELATDIVADSAEGDFYFNTSNGEISIKQADGTWKFVFQYEGKAPGTEEKKHIKVNLNLNGGQLVDPDDVLTFKILDGTTFNQPIPLAKKEGAEFIGWYTDAVLTPVSGKLTMNTVIVPNPNEPSTGAWTYYAQFTQK